MTERMVGITGPSGFIAGHLLQRLRHEPQFQELACGRDAWSDHSMLASLVQQCDALVHLAGLNRGDDSEITKVNVGLAEKLGGALAAGSQEPHVIFASSTQRDRNGAYGSSKKQAEDILAHYAKQQHSPLSILVIPNVYGAGCRPFYNSVVATFCHQLAHDQQPQIADDREIEFISVNELVQRILEEIDDPPTGVRISRIGGTARMRVSELLELLRSFRNDFFDRDTVPDLTDPIHANLYTTFLSYLELDHHRHRPELRTDPRGSLFEIIKMANGGQVFFSSTKPGVVRGDHYHTRKVEWFCVVRGEAVIRMRRIGSQDVREFRVSGDSPEFISIPVFHTHSIENVGDDELLTMFWCNEIFDADNPDTHFEKVA